MEEQGGQGSCGLHINVSVGIDFHPYMLSAFAFISSRSAFGPAPVRGIRNLRCLV
jgi:hypothetical protein